MFWADQPGPGTYRLAGARSAAAQAAVFVYAHANGRVCFELPVWRWDGWPGPDFGGWPTGAYPATSAAGIRVAERLCATGPDRYRGLTLVWRWERFDNAGRGPGRWVNEGPVEVASVLPAASSARLGHEVQR